MKIIFYENQQNQIWFKGRRAALGPGKVFFSNSPEWVEKFNNESVENLKNIVKSSLPRREVSRNENNSILYIPFEMRDQFIQVLDALGFQARDYVPTSGELGLGNEEPRTLFYDGIIIRKFYKLDKETQEHRGSESQGDEANGQTNDKKTKTNTLTLGKFFNWLKTRWGLAVIIAVPAILISFFIFMDGGHQAK